MKNLNILILATFILSTIALAQTKSPTISLKWNLKKKLPGFSIIFSDTQNVKLQSLKDKDGFSATVSTDTTTSLSQWKISIDAPFESIVKVNPITGEMAIHEGIKNFEYNLSVSPQVFVLHDTLVVSKIFHDTLIVIDEKKLSDQIKYTFIPGGTRFYNNSKFWGIVIGTFELVPIPFWLYYNHQYNEYYDEAVTLARNWQIAQADIYKQQINDYYNQSQDFKQYRDISAVVMGTAFLINMIDSFLNVKTRVGVFPKTLQDMGLKIEPNLRNGVTRFRIVKSF